MYTHKILLALALLLTVSTASAQGFYAGGGLGITQIEEEDSGLTYKDSPIGWRLTAGYDFNENFAIEGGYVSSGEAEDDIQGENVKAELKALTLSVVGLIPVGESAKLFGKLGFYDGEQEVTVLGLTLDDDESGATVGGGIRFDFSNNWTLRGDFDWYDTDLDTVWSIGAGVQYRFGQ